jgi:hypothetical protein
MSVCGATRSGQPGRDGAEQTRRDRQIQLRPFAQAEYVTQYVERGRVLGFLKWTDVPSCPRLRSVTVRSKRACVHSSMAVLRLLLTEEEDMTTLLIVLLVLFVLGGGGWGYSRWRA